MRVVLERYHGLGNDYLIFDPNNNELELNKENIKMICQRNFGVGSDGILMGPIFDGKKISLRIFNPDGSEAEKSGNGARIFAKYLKDADYIQKSHARFMTVGGEIEAYYLNEEGTRLKVSMGELSFHSDDIRVTGEPREVIDEEMIFDGNAYAVTCVSIGNPHCVIPVEEISKDLICKIGPFSERDERFPNKMNTVLLKVIDSTNIKIEIYERGAGYTLASGTSACAAAGAAYQLGLADPKMYVHMPGGMLEIEIQEDGKVLMTGDVCYIGKITVAHGFGEKLRSI